MEAVFPFSGILNPQRTADSGPPTPTTRLSELVRRLLTPYSAFKGRRFPGTNALRREPVYLDAGEARLIGSHELLAVSNCHRLRSVVHAELRVDVAQVSRHRLVADYQPSLDLIRRHALGEQAEDLVLAPRQFELRRRRGRRAAEQSTDTREELIRGDRLDE